MIQQKPLLNTSTVLLGDPIVDLYAGSTFQATITGTGVLSAIVNIYGSLDGTYINIGTINLYGTTSASAGFSTKEAWAHYKAECTYIIGTNAYLTVNMVEET